MLMMKEKVLLVKTGTKMIHNLQLKKNKLLTKYKIFSNLEKKLFWVINYSIKKVQINLKHLQQEKMICKRYGKIINNIKTHK